MSDPRKVAKIYDAESWQDARRPDPSPERLRYEAAAIGRDAIGKRMRDWSTLAEPKPRSGADYEHLVAEWVDATTTCDRAYDEMITAELRNRSTGKSEGEVDA